MANGSEEKVNPTDQQCPHCDRWYSKRGVYSHKENCPQKEDESNQLETMPSNLEDDGDDESHDYCPECGNRDNDQTPKIYFASDVLEVAGEDLPPSDANTLENHEYFCDNCNSAFDNLNHD